MCLHLGTTIVHLHFLIVFFRFNVIIVVVVNFLKAFILLFLQHYQGWLKISKDTVCHYHFFAISCIFCGIYLVNFVMMNSAANVFHSTGLVLTTFQDVMDQVLFVRLLIKFPSFISSCVSSLFHKVLNFIHCSIVMLMHPEQLSCLCIDENRYLGTQSPPLYFYWFYFFQVKSVH